MLGATAAHAGTHWSVGINVPAAGIVVSNGGGSTRAWPGLCSQAVLVVRSLAIVEDVVLSRQVLWIRIEPCFDVLWLNRELRPVAQ